MRADRVAPDRTCRAATWIFRRRRPSSWPARRPRSRGCTGRRHRAARRPQAAASASAGSRRQPQRHRAARRPHPRRRHRGRGARCSPPPRRPSASRSRWTRPFDKTLEELLAAGTDRRIAEGKARRAGDDRRQEGGGRGLAAPRRMDATESIGRWARQAAGSATGTPRCASGAELPVPASRRARRRARAHARGLRRDSFPTREDLIDAFTGMHVRGFRSRAWVMSRGEWIRPNLHGLQRLLEPLAARLLANQADRAEFRRKALGAQAGGLLGYVARRVLGQYDVFLPPDDEGLLYFVGPNVAEVGATLRMPTSRLPALDRRSTRSRIGSSSVGPWLRATSAAWSTPTCATVSLDSHELFEQLKSAAEEMRSGSDGAAWAACSCCLTPSSGSCSPACRG